MNYSFKKNILVICPYPRNTAAGQRLKYEQYIQDWEVNGYNVKVSSFINKSTWNVLYKKGYFFQKLIGLIKGYCKRFKDLFHINNYDLVYIHMWVTPYGSQIYERLFLFLSKKVIFDLEDNVLIQKNFNDRNNPNKITNFMKNTAKQFLLIKESDYVITSSPELEKICLKLNKNKNACYITSSINVKKFVPKKFSNEKVVIGWTGTFSSKKYLDLIKDVFQELAKECDYELHIIGNFEYDLPNVNLVVKKWSLEEEVEQMQALDIGIYPLPLEDVWVEGKSGLKAIQYMAFGIPTVATKVGHTPNIIKHREEGILVERKKEWLFALKELIFNKRLRIEMGNKARKKAVDKYSLQVVSKSYARILNLCTNK